MSNSRPYVRPISRPMVSRPSEDTDDFALQVDVPGVTLTGLIIGDELQITAHGGAYDGASATFTTAEIDSGLPLQIAAPTQVADDGDTRNILPGLYASTADVEYLTRWYRGDYEISGETGQSYTLVAGDAGQFIQYRETPSTIYGVPLAAPYVVTVQQGYAEVGIAFNDSQFSTGAVGAMNYTKGLIFASFLWPDYGNRWKLIGFDTSLATAQGYSGGAAKLEAGFGDATTNLTPASAFVGKRAHVLMSLDNTAVNIAYQIDGNMLTATATKSSANWITETWRACSIGTKYSNDTPAGTVFRAAVWVDPITVPDITDPAVQANFFAGDLMVDPALAEAAYGQPFVDVRAVSGHADGQSGITYLNGTGDYAGRGPGHYGTHNTGVFASLSNPVGVAV